MKTRGGVTAVVVLVWAAMVMIVAAPVARAQRATATARPAPSTPASAALDKPAFTATARELLDAAKATPVAAGNWPAVVLRHETELSADEQGRFTRRERQVLVIKSQVGTMMWGALSASWSPFYQDRPRVRARVIDPAGAIAELDPAKITDAPDVDVPPAAPSDRRTLEAVLPRLQIGAIVEQETITQDRLPLLSAGGAQLETVPLVAPIASLRITVSAPSARKPRHVATGLPATAKPVHRIAGGRESWIYELQSLPGETARFEAFAPREESRAPAVGIATAASWNAVAREYRALLERRLAEGPVSLPAELPHAPTIEAVRAIATWLHGKVRSTGVGFREGTLAPSPPAEALGRGAAGATDKALLLVALLRRAGLRADLALTSHDGVRDLALELPGLQWFDHALVRSVIGGRDVWIDPAEELYAPGQLSAGLQGRRALIIADDATALVTIPIAPAADNLTRHVRTFQLAEYGPAERLTEVTRESGAFEVGQRRWLRDTAPDELREAFSTYAERAYSGTYARHAATAPADLTTPSTTTLEVTKAARAFTDRNQIRVSMFVADVLENVPPFLLSDEPFAARTRDFQWSQPHTMEIETRLILPPGYNRPALPPDQVTALGTATLTERHRLEGDTVVVTLRFDSGKPRLTPAELATLHRELRAAKDRAVTVAIEHTGMALSEAGKPKEAIAELERLIRLHPTEALHYSQLAHAYIAIGMGSAARRAARRATSLEPRNADAHVVLGWTLRHDSLGRDFGFDHDRAGALAAFAKARQLDPKHVGAAYEHGDLLRRSPRGHAFAEGSDLPRAIEALRATYAIEASEDHGVALAATLFRAEQLAEAERVLRAMPASETRDAMLVGVVAAGAGGAPAAVQVAGTLRTGPARAKLFAEAATMMMYTRRYEEMRALRVHSPWPAGSPQAEMGRLVTRREPARPSRDPAWLPFELLRQEFDRDTPTEAFWDALTRDEHRRGPMKAERAAVEVGFDVMRDLMTAIAEVHVSGTEAAWRLELTVSGQTETIYAALDRGIAKIIGTKEHPAGVGRHVLRLVARNELSAATALLDWLAPDIGPRPTLHGLWGTGKPRDKDAIALAGAVVADETDPARVLPIAVRCASPLPDAREACDTTLAEIYRTRKQWRELEAHAAAWASRNTKVNGLAAMARTHALVKLGRFDEAEKVYADLAAAFPIPPVVRFAPYLAISRGHLVEAVQRFDAVLQQPFADRMDRNNAAWLRLFTETDLAAALDLAQKAVGPDKALASDTSLNTLGAIEAERGDLHAAKLDGWQAMENGTRRIPGDQDWYLAGRIAEQLGLRDDAIAAYRKVKPEPEVAMAGYHLAQRRLARLGAKP